MQPYTTFQNAALLILRVILAITFLYAGIAKWFLWSTEPMEGMPVWLHYLMLFLSIVEPIGAVAVLAGVLTRWAAAGFVIIMIGAMAVSHFIMGYAFFTAPQAPGWDINLMIFGGSLALAAFGAGAWSIDSYWKKA